MVSRILAAFFRALLRLRYRVRIRGLDQIESRQGLIILPNHPAEIDPVILCCYFWRRFPIRPVILESYYHLPLAHALMKYIGAIPMPDMEVNSGAYKRKRVEKALQAAVSAVQVGDNLLIYPSGTVSATGYERIGANSGTRLLLDRPPQASVVLVRTRGLYGSSFSKASTGGRSPDFFKTLLHGAWVAVKNLLFLVPKREVTIEVKHAPADFPRSADVMTLNRWLERWYNSDGAEAPHLVSYSFWRQELPPEAPAAAAPEQFGDVPPEITGKIIAKLGETTGLPPAQIRLEQRLADDLGIDSLSAAELLLWLDEEFAVSDVDLAELTTVGSVIRAAAGRSGPETGAEPAAAGPMPEWHADMEMRPAPAFIPGGSIPAVFLRKAAQMGSGVALADDRSGVLSWKRLTRAALALAAEIEKLPGKNIGVMLPASAGATITILAAMLARKVPVLLNWTAGRISLEHSTAAAAVEAVLTSAPFLDRIETDLASLEEKLVLLEDLRKQIGWRAKLRAAWRASLSPVRLASRLKLNTITPDSTAVILFTSGSEAAPKGVPLTHRNILVNLEAVLNLLHFERSDVYYSFLPPFHSFGLTVGTIMPIIAGLKVVYHPNPNESRKIAAGCARWGVTLLVGTPTFLRTILQSGAPSQFKTVRLLVSGAEKAPEVLFESVAALNSSATLIEGYGITECSPVVSANLPGQPRLGVGKPLPGVEVLIVDHERLEQLPAGERGLILIRGSNVFPGYLEGKPDPFLTVQGKRWYNSGDLGLLQNGHLIISGRLKRFVKIAGEMISLPAVEEALAGALPAPDDKPALALTAVENDTKRPVLYLFTTREISAAQANEVIKRAGFPNLVKVAQVIQLPEIPLLGSGKVDVQSLNRMIAER